MSYARLSPKPITFSGLPAGIYDRASLGEALVQTILSIIGDDPSREGLKETPQRVVKAYGEWFEGYHQDPVAILKTFEDGAEGCQNELVLVRDIEFYSHCEHHMAPFFGKAHVAYVPNGKVLGLSKLARLVDVFAKRLQVQERLTNQIAHAHVPGTLNVGRSNFQPHDVFVVRVQLAGILHDQDSLARWRNRQQGAEQCCFPASRSAADQEGGARFHQCC